MKIAYLSAGINVYDYRFLEKMLERGHKPIMISCWFEQPNFEMNGVPFYYYRPKYLSKLKIAIFLRRLLREIKPDILHTGYIQTHGFYGALSGFHPRLLMPWGSDILIAPFKSKIIKAITKYTIMSTDMITCDANYVKKKIITLANYPDKKIVVFPWGIDLNIFKPSFSENKIKNKLGWSDKKVLIMTRNFKPIYGIEYFIKALPDIIISEPNIRVILAGSQLLDPDYSSKIMNMIEKLELQKYVHFTGWLEERELSDYLNSSDIYLSTSLSDGTSSSLLEAMACGLPVVVSDLPSNSEWVRNGENGYLVPLRDSKMLAKQIIRLLDNDTLSQQMGLRNLQIAKKRADWEINFSKLENIYETLVKKKKEAP